LKEEGEDTAVFRGKHEEDKDRTACKRKLTDSLLAEIENKLKKAIRTGDVTDIGVAQILLETVWAKHEDERQTAKVANEI